MTHVPVPMTDPRNVEEVRAAVACVQQGVAAVRDEVARHVIGQEDAVDSVLACLLIGGHALLEGVPGTGKTLLVRTMAAACGMDMGRVQFTPDLLPADITGTVVMAPDGRGGRATVFRRGPVFHQVVLADEINRGSPRTQAALLEAMEERQVTIAGATHPLPEPFVVLATRNPVEQLGTHRLPEAQLDRFAMQINLTPPDVGPLATIVGQTTGAAETDVRFVLQPGFACATRRLTRHVLVAPHVDRWIAGLVAGTGDPAVGRDVAANTRGAVSPRAGIAIRQCARITALSAGRVAVSVADVRRVAPLCLRHRLVPSVEAAARGETSESLIDTLLAIVPTPADEVMP